MLVRNVLLSVVVASLYVGCSSAHASDTDDVKVASLARHHVRAKLPPLASRMPMSRSTGDPEDKSVGVIRPIGCEIVGSTAAARGVPDVNSTIGHQTQASPFSAIRNDRAFAVLTFAAEPGFVVDNTRLKVFRYSTQPPTPASVDYTPVSPNEWVNWEKQNAIGYCVANNEWFPVADNYTSKQMGLRIHLFRQGPDVMAKIRYCNDSATLKLTPVPGSPTNYRLVLPLEVTKAAVLGAKYGLVAFRQPDHSAYAVGTTRVNGK